MILLSCKPLYGSVMLILRWRYDYIFFFAYIWIDKSYDSDDLPLTQMVLQRNSEVNDGDKIPEDEEDDASFREDNEFSYETDDEGMCILVWFLWYSYAWIASVTYILCIFFWIAEITPQRKTMTPQKVCRTPTPK